MNLGLKVAAPMPRPPADFDGDLFTRGDARSFLVSRAQGGGERGWVALVGRPRAKSILMCHRMDVAGAAA